jgi:hypothetical protein
MASNEFRVEKTEDGGWRVSLPHQCDRWDIAGDEFRGVPLEDARDELRKFILDATDALQALSQMKEFEDGEAKE